jgi:hypothetical protein
MIFIDGFGLGSDDRSGNPFTIAAMPFIKGLLGGEGMTRIHIGEGVLRSHLVIRPTDAGLDVTGIPQSATGQTALFTGINVAKITGRHINGFPTKLLREVLQRGNLFKAVNRSGLRAVFANIFTEEYFQAVERGQWRHSVTTTAALAGGCHFLLIPDLLHGKGVFQDITNEQLRERGYDVPILEPETAALNLIRQASQNDFTLFEYFQTDHCGHDQNWDLALVLLNRLDRFLHTIAGQLTDYNLDLLVVSDHGNIEDLSIKTHTTNLVPTIAIGKGAARFAGVSSLPDIYPKVLECLGLEAGPANVTI